MEFFTYFICNLLISNLCFGVRFSVKYLLSRRDSKKFEETAAYLHDNSLLDAAHWSVGHQTYMDWGLHTDDVSLARPKPPPHVHPSQVDT